MGDSILEVLTFLKHFSELYRKDVHISCYMSPKSQKDAKFINQSVAYSTIE